jgi:hypothetical protein
MKCKDILLVSSFLVIVWVGLYVIGNGVINVLHLLMEYNALKQENLIKDK